MASILPGFEYDIFISYRQKDNKYDGWVTEFVQNLKRELEATFKEDISIYFDSNPDDGLLETHNVDKSLESKLKSLIFLPILSQTYCDTRSFAWQHEFVAFNKLAQEDQFGRDIRLAHGNVASRILPVRIRELDEEDKNLLEKELGGVLRAVDFIYKEAGVNRPLKPEDPEEKNLAKTKYRNQVNKTANAIKEIITGLKNFQSKEKVTLPKEEPVEVPSEKEKKPRKKITRTLLFIGLAIFFIVRFFQDKHDDDEPAGRSIAVLPFEDLSPGHDQEYFSDGIAEEILNSLAHIKELKVAGRTSSFQFKGQKADLKEVGEKLNVNTVLEGSVRKMGNRVRITAQLIGVKDGYHIWSETYDRDMTDIFAIQNEVAERIAKVLLKELTVDLSSSQKKGTENPKAYEYYLEGKYINLHQFATERKIEDFKRSEELLKKSLALDSNYALAHAGLADLYNTYTARISRDPVYMDLQQKEIKIAYSLGPDLDYVNNALGQVQNINGEFEKAFASFNRALELNPNDANNMLSLASSFQSFGLLDEGLTMANHAIQSDPLEPNNYYFRGLIHFQLAQYDEALNDFRETLKQQPQNQGAHVFLAFYYLIKDQPLEAKKYIDQANQISRAPFVASAEAMYEARLGHREKALQLSKDFRVYLILGMNEEGIKALLELFSKAQAPLSSYLVLKKSSLITRVESDPRVVNLIEKQKIVYNENKKKFRLPKNF
jgi:TolB-like protein